MPQYGRPKSVAASSGTWTAAGSAPSTNLWENCDEVVPDGDVSYVKTTSVTPVMRFQINDLTDPGVDTDHYITVQARARTGAAGAAESYVVRLMTDGSTVRWTSAAQTLSRLSWRTAVLAVPSANIALVASYAGWKIDVTFTSAAGEEIDLGFVEVKVPSATVSFASAASAASLLTGQIERTHGFASVVSAGSLLTGVVLNVVPCTTIYPRAAHVLPLAGRWQFQKGPHTGVSTQRLVRWQIAAAGSTFPAASPIVDTGLRVPDSVALGVNHWDVYPEDHALVPSTSYAVSHMRERTDGQQSPWATAVTFSTVAQVIARATYLGAL